MPDVVDINVKRSEVVPYRKTFSKAFPRQVSDNQRMKLAARMIEYRALGLSWEDCEKLIDCEISQRHWLTSGSDIRRIAEWRLENVHEEKMSLPPKQWKSSEDNRRERLNEELEAFWETHREILNVWKKCIAEWMAGPQENSREEFSATFVREHGQIPRFPRFDELQLSKRQGIEWTYGCALAD